MFRRFSSAGSKPMKSFRASLLHSSCTLGLRQLDSGFAMHPSRCGHSGFSGSFLSCLSCPPGCCCPAASALVLCESLGLRSLPGSVPLTTLALSMTTWQCGPPALVLLLSAGAEPRSQPAVSLPSRPALQPGVPAAPGKPHRLHHLRCPLKTGKPHALGFGGQPHLCDPSGSTSGSDQAAGPQSEGKPAHRHPARPPSLADSAGRL